MPDTALNSYYAGGSGPLLFCIKLWALKCSEVAAGDFKMYIDDDAGLLSLSHRL